MLEEFLRAEYTQKNRLQDFSEWHKGISNYGFWCIEIVDEEWNHYIRDCQRQLQHRLITDYQRQPHITLCACGLIDAQHFSQSQLEQQILAIAEQSLTFDITMIGIDSFTTAPYIAIESAGELQQLNKQLASVSEDTAPYVYTPHITLGLYNDDYPSEVIAAELRNLEPVPQHALQVKDLLFASYATHELQGPFTTKQRLRLNLRYSG